MSPDVILNFTRTVCFIIRIGKQIKESVTPQWSFYEDLVRERDENGGIKRDTKGRRGYTSNALHYTGDLTVRY